MAVAASPVGRVDRTRLRRVQLRPPTLRDAPRFLQAMQRSRALHGPWLRAPRSREAYLEYLRRCRDTRFESFLVEHVHDSTLIGVISLSQIVHGNLLSAHLEFYAVAGQTGQGLMAEAVARLIGHAFRTRRLHRLEGYVQPANRLSRALLRRCGFCYEGLARRVLKIGGRWRDHERWVLLREDWQRERAGR